MRADQWLLDRGLAASRSQAQRLLAAGARWRVPGGAWRALVKSDALPPDAQVEMDAKKAAGYFTDKVPDAAELARIKGRGLQE